MCIIIILPNVFCCNAASFCLWAHVVICTVHVKMYGICDFFSEEGNGTPVELNLPRKSSIGSPKV